MPPALIRYFYQILSLLPHVHTVQILRFLDDDYDDIATSPGGSTLPVPHFPNIHSASTDAPPYGQSRQSYISPSSLAPRSTSKDHNTFF
jgi:hypothetical protein